MLGEPDERTVIHAARPQAPGRTARKASWGLARRDERVIIGPGVGFPSPARFGSHIGIRSPFVSDVRRIF